MADAMMAFLRAPTWEDSELILFRHPELMNDAGYKLLSLVFCDPRMHPVVYPTMDPKKAADLMEFHRILLGRCQELGIREAFAELRELNNWWNNRKIG
jgi:hypothetical protein